MQNVLERSVTYYIHRLFVVLDEDTNVASAVQQMHSHKSNIIIVSRGSRAIGIVTDSDILDQVVMKGENSDQVSLKTVMSVPLVTISAKGNAKQALQLMRINQIKHLPVVDTAGVIGIVTQETLANAVRTSVMERTFGRYRSLIREQYKPILGNLGILLQFSGILLVVPAFLGTALGEGASVTGIFFAVVGLSFSGFFLANIGEKGPMNLKQASIFIVSSFVILSLFGSIPYIYINPFGSGIDPSSLFVNSFFESASGFTTTGLSVISNPENLPDSLNFYHSYTQWVGGLSFVYLVMILFFPERKLSAMKSVLGGGMLRVKELLITLVVIFSVYTVVLTVLLTSFSQTSNLDATLLMFSTLSSGGFIPDSTIITPEHPVRLIILGPGMILAALPFAFHYHIFSRSGLWKKKTISAEVKVYLIAMAAAISVFYMLCGGQVDIYSALFHIVSGSTTTGFQYLDISSIPAGAKAFMIVAMLVGGTAFSTAGGIKIGRLVILYQEFTKKAQEKDMATITGQSTSTSISAMANPYRDSEFLPMLRKEYQKHDFEKVVEQQERLVKRILFIASKKVVREILIIIALYIAISFITGSILSSRSGSSFEDAMFESVSALTTTGLTAGVTSIDLDSSSKVMLTVNMILGRFEIIAILYIFVSYLRR